MDRQSLNHFFFTSSQWARECCLALAAGNLSNTADAPRTSQRPCKDLRHRSGHASIFGIAIPGPDGRSAAPKELRAVLEPTMIRLIWACLMPSLGQLLTSIVSGCPFRYPGAPSLSRIFAPPLILRTPAWDADGPNKDPLARFCCTEAQDCPVLSRFGLLLSGCTL